MGYFMRLALKEGETVLLCGEFQVGSVLSEHDGRMTTEFWTGV
jgi:hypothetical protein